MSTTDQLLLKLFFKQWSLTVTVRGLRDLEFTIKANMGLLWNPQSRDMGVRISKEERIGWCQLWLSERRSDLNPWVWEGPNPAVCHSPCIVWGFRGHSPAYSPSNPHHSIDNRWWLFWGFEVLLLSTNRYTERWQHNVFINPNLYSYLIALVTWTGITQPKSHRRYRKWVVNQSSLAPAWIVHIILMYFYSCLQ